MSLRIIVALSVAVLFWGTCGDVRGADELGVYFDENAETSCITPTLYPAILYAYVVYSNPSVAEISGFELGVAIYQLVGQQPIIWPAQAPCSVSATNLAQVSVRCLEPIPCGPHTTLLSIPIYWWGGLTEIAVGGAATPSLPITGPFVVLRDGTGLSVGRYPVWGVLDAGFDRCRGLPVEGQTWGAVKGLYR